MASYSAAVSNRTPKRTRRVLAVLSVVALLVAAGPARAADDVLLDLLHERGIVNPGADADPRSPQSGLHAANAAASSLVIAALGFLDTPYQWGGNSVASGFDCSGFTQHLFDLALAQPLPRRAEDQARDASLHDVALADLRPGDLVFFNTLQRPFSHVGVYIGDGRFVHAPRAGRAISVENLHDRYWASRFDGARRAIEGERVLPATRG